MTIYLPKNHPALAALSQEGIDIKPRPESSAKSACKIAFVNLMGDPKAAEIDMARALSEADKDVELIFYGPSTRLEAAEKTIEAGVPGSNRHERARHRTLFQEKLPALQSRTDIDGIILSGFPIEDAPLQQADINGENGVDFYGEFVGLLGHIRKTNTSTLATCWAAHVALHELHGIARHVRRGKLTGVFSVEVIDDKSPLTRNLGEAVPMPVSRFGVSDERQIQKNTNLLPIASSEETGAAILRESNGPIIYMTGHLEYGEETLLEEFNRDLENMGEDAPRPANYSLTNPQRTWARQATAFYNNLVQHFMGEHANRSEQSSQPQAFLGNDGLTPTRPAF